MLQAKVGAAARREVVDSFPPAALSSKLEAAIRDGQAQFGGQASIGRHYTYTPFTERQVCASGFLERFTEACRRDASLVRFLCRALELPYTG